MNLYLISTYGSSRQDSSVASVPSQQSSWFSWDIYSHILMHSLTWPDHFIPFFFMMEDNECLCHSQYSTHNVISSDEDVQGKVR